MSVKSLLSNKSLCIQEAVNTIVSAACHHLWVSRSEGTTIVREEDVCLRGDSPCTAIAKYDAAIFILL